MLTFTTHDNCKSVENMKLVLISLVSLAFLSGFVSGATFIYLKSATLAGFALQDGAGKPLSAGFTENGDGTLLEFGYYSAASSADPFARIWNPLTGPASESMIVTTIGDGLPPENGVFSIGLYLDTALPGFPADGTPLALRFYNGKTRATSTSFNAVANPGDQWAANSVGTEITMLIGTEPGTVWQGGAASSFRTALPIPECGPAVLLSAAIALLSFRRRRPSA